MASGVNDHGESPSLSPVRQNIQPSVPAAIERGSKWSKRRDPDSINKDRPQKDTKSKRKRNIASPSIPKGKRQRGSQPSPEPMDSSTHSRTLRSTTRAASTTTPAGSSSTQPSGAGRGGLQQRHAQPGGRGAAGLAAADGGLSGGGDGTGQQHGRAGVARTEPLSAAHQVAEEVGGGGVGGGVADVADVIR